MTNINEFWVKIKDYEGLYEVSNFGRIRSFKRKNPKILKSFKPSGRVQVSLSKNGTIKHYLIHRLVISSFIEPPKYNYDVDHIDGNCFNNNLLNLRYCNRRENITYYREKQASSSKYVGVSWSKLRKKWVSYIRINNSLINLGFSDSEEEASEFYKKALEKLANNA